MAAAKTESVQCFGRKKKKKAVAVTHCKKGRGLIKINGVPIELVQPEILRYKAFEPILLLGRHRFAGVDMRICVKGGGHTSLDLRYPPGQLLKPSWPSTRNTSTSSRRRRLRTFLLETTGLYLWLIHAAVSRRRLVAVELVLGSRNPTVETPVL
ncbi:Uncharacterized protein Adt_05436 [Abeliophyllum distichum]|uniref:Ribosomal protein S16 n=1 Tax=Abeliophyllum distichum TaxID=126358 RepID=A0ABD1V662_9LAMI